jgi:hypothetical protein
MRPEPTICWNPNCGYSGKMRRVRRGSYAIAAVTLVVLPVLWGMLHGLLGIGMFFVGICYLVFCVDEFTVCPRCGAVLSRDL